MQHCDPATGLCELPDTATGRAAPAAATHSTLHYIGDPMCSWCWGLAPTLQALAERCARDGLGFQITVGGLRAGGGEAWNARFKDFLRQEWTHIAQVTGQPFSFALLEREHFDYDTEPACRAVVAAATLLAGHDPGGLRLLAFFARLQHAFYVDGHDPAALDTYPALCVASDLDFAAFSTEFLSDHARQHTREHFQRCRQWGVRGFPSVVLEHHGELYLLSAGYADHDTLFARLDAALARPAS